MPQVFNREETKKFRRELRKQNVGAEKELWSKLRHDKLGYRFRRQYGIGKYIVDFYCPRLKLVIEVDGATHAAEEEIKNDNIRQKYLESLGLIVKRYINADIYSNIGLVVYNIWKKD
jgi:very-short-patch-repair endonuclease